MCRSCSDIHKLGGPVRLGIGTANSRSPTRHLACFLDTLLLMNLKETSTLAFLPPGWKALRTLQEAVVWAPGFRLPEDMSNTPCGSAPSGLAVTKVTAEHKLNPCSDSSGVERSTVRREDVPWATSAAYGEEAKNILRLVVTGRYLKGTNILLHPSEPVRLPLRRTAPWLGSCDQKLGRTGQVDTNSRQDTKRIPSKKFSRAIAVRTNNRPSGSWR
jgi:hypothetical protein